MAKSEKSAKGPTVDSTTRVPKTNKATSKRKPSARAGTQRDCCAALAPHMNRLMSILDTIANAPSGAMLTTEDGVLVAVPPPTAAGRWRFDPAVSPFPYWEPEAAPQSAPQAASEVTH